MAPITCKVVDSFHRGISDVHAFLQCKDQHNRVISTFESCTNGEGDIRYWFRAPFVGSAEPETVDIHYTPFISITLTPPPHLARLAAPWVRIHNDLHLPPEYCHGIVLHMFQHTASYRLEHTRKLAELSQANVGRECSSTTFDLMDCDNRRTPSPLQLPSPVLGHIFKKTPPGQR